MTWTIERIRARCEICSDEDGGCWLWRGGMMRDKYPIAQEAAPELHCGQRQFYVRRRMYELSTGRKAPTTPAHVITCTCGHDRCVAPHHTAKRSKSQVLRESEAVTLVNRLNAAKNARRRAATSKVPDHAVATIRGSERPLREIAHEWGISISWAAALRSGAARRDYSSPFASLMPGRRRASA
jgi:hypothetical protein